MTVDGSKRVYAAGIRAATSDGGEFQVFRMDPKQDTSSSIWTHDNRLGSETDWSEYAAPDIVSTSVGTVFAVAVKRSGQMHSFVRNHSTGDWRHYGQIGGSGWTGNGP